MVKNINKKVSQQWRLAILTGYQPITNYWERFNESERLGVSGIFNCCRIRVGIDVHIDT